jgi:hypothetical protein
MDWRASTIALGLAGGVALATSRLFDLAFLPVFLVVIGALIVNGLVATLEDDLPGGFENPDGTHTPRYARIVVRIGRWGLAALLWASGATFLALGISTGGRGAAATGIGGFLACVLLSIVLLRRRRTTLGGTSWRDLVVLHLRARLLGDGDAQCGLGAIYATGDHDEWPSLKSEAKAVRWYTRAAQHGHAAAQYNLGFMILLGEGTSADPDLALRWLERAAEGGSDDAAKLLCDLYDGRGQARGIAHDPERAAHWRSRRAR